MSLVVVLRGEREGGAQGHILTLSANLECDSNHDEHTVRVTIDLEVVALGSIVEHEESVADANGVSDTVVCRERGAVVKGVDCVCLSSHSTPHHFTHVHQ